LIVQLDTSIRSVCECCNKWVTGVQWSLDYPAIRIFDYPNYSNDFSIRVYVGVRSIKVIEQGSVYK